MGGDSSARDASEELLAIFQKYADGKSTISRKLMEELFKVLLGGHALGAGAIGRMLDLFVDASGCILYAELIAWLFPPTLVKVSVRSVRNELLLFLDGVSEEATLRSIASRLPQSEPRCCWEFSVAGELCPLEMSLSSLPTRGSAVLELTACRQSRATELLKAIKRGDAPGVQAWFSEVALIAEQDPNSLEAITAVAHTSETARKNGYLNTAWVCDKIVAGMDGEVIKGFPPKAPNLLKLAAEKGHVDVCKVLGANTTPGSLGQKVAMWDLEGLARKSGHTECADYFRSLRAGRAASSRSRGAPLNSPRPG